MVEYSNSLAYLLLRHHCQHIFDMLLLEVELEIGIDSMDRHYNCKQWATQWVWSCKYSWNFDNMIHAETYIYSRKDNQQCIPALPIPEQHQIQEAAFINMDAISTWMRRRKKKEPTKPVPLRQSFLPNWFWGISLKPLCSDS